MTTQTSTRPAAPQFRLSRTSAVRDVAIVAVCVAIVGGFLLHAWRAPAPEQFRRVAEPTSLTQRS